MHQRAVFAFLPGAHHGIRVFAQIIQPDGGAVKEVALVAVLGGIEVLVRADVAIIELRNGHVHAINIEAPRHAGVLNPLRSLICIGLAVQDKFHIPAVHTQDEGGFLSNFRESPILVNGRGVPANPHVEAINVIRSGIRIV